MSVSYWSANFTLPEFPVLSSDIHDDIVVIGAGIAGLTIAYLLLKEKKSVTVVTSGQIASGETCRTTGHLTCMLDTRFFELEKMFGKESISKSLKSHTKAIDLIEKICQEEHIDCDFFRLNAHLFQESDVSSDILQKEYDTVQAIGFHDVKIEKSPFSFFQTGNMLTFFNQAQFHPLKYIAGLVKAIQKYDGKIYSDAHVVEIEGGKVCKAFTKNQFAISAKKMVVATNTPINNRFIMHTKQAAYRTYALSAKISKGTISRALYYDTLDPYHYIRIHERDNHDILIIGGEDHKTGQDNHCKLNFQKLETWAKNRFAISEITNFWSGQVLEPIDSLGYIGKNPLEENIYIITGHSGNGLTYSTLGGMIVRDLILEKPSEYEQLYRPSRITFTATDEFLKENMNVGKQYIKWLHPSLDHSVDDLPNNAGKIIQKKHEKIAVYRDNDGKCHEISAICPHLGCIVNWNDAEKTWDCPCHGSRFESTGQVICGPTTSELKPTQDT